MSLAVHEYSTDNYRFSFTLFNEQTLAMTIRNNSGQKVCEKTIRAAYFQLNFAKLRSSSEQNYPGLLITLNEVRLIPSDCLYDIPPSTFDDRLVLVPRGMSFVNAFYALFTQGERGDTRARSLTPAKVVEIFRREINMREQQRHISFDYVQNQPIKADFTGFPILTIQGYDGAYKRDGAARTALVNYAAIPSEERCDQNDTASFAEFEKLIQQRWEKINECALL